MLLKQQEFLQDQARDQQAEKVQPQPAGLQNSQLMFAQEAVPSLLGQPGPVSSSQGSVQDVTRAAALKTTLVPDKAAEGQCIQQSDAGPDSEKHLAAQERIQQSKEASTSGRSALPVDVALCKCACFLSFFSILEASFMFNGKWH